MFQRLFSWWKEDILLKKALEDSALALEKAKNMFSFAMSVLLESVEEEKSIYDMDKEVNTLQLNIRKKVFEHLTINPEQDLTASLVLTTIIVDIERMGDFSKNIVELHHMCICKLGHTRYIPEIKNIREKLEDLILKTKDAFIEANAEESKSLMAEYTWIGNKCDSTLESLAGDESLGVRDAVIYGLLFRYLKRISAHARNISSSVVNPFHRIGYSPE